jgi:3D (Asp-Asp-Asp) domain-containing protein
MFISKSFVRKAVVTLGAAVGFVFVYETTIRDSRYAARHAMVAEAAPQPTTVGTPLAFSATAYCKGETTASGVVVRTGVAAADPALLPVGSVVRIDTPDTRYDGIWTIMDTGPAVQGRTLDLYMWSCSDALKFGRRSVRVNVLRLGWNPQNSEPGVVDVLFRRREKEKAEAPIPASVMDPQGVLVAPVAPPLPPPES